MPNRTEPQGPLWTISLHLLTGTIVTLMVLTVLVDGAPLRALAATATVLALATWTFMIFATSPLFVDEWPPPDPATRVPTSWPAPLASTRVGS